MNSPMSRGVVASCFIAGCLEIYDFTIFAFLTPILHKNYLNFMDAKDALIISYGLFAVGFLFRPLGSVLFGYIGDRFGRKKSLVISVSLMGSASLIMVVLPPYVSIGILSCYIICLVRVIQGLSVGGEYSGAIIYAIEHFDKRKTGVIGAIVVSGCLFGVMLGRLVGNILQNQSLPDYSWRFAFLLGFVLSIVGYFIRNKLTESPEFKKLSESKAKSVKIPLLEGLKHYPKEMISAIALIGANGVSFYFIVVFFPDYIKKTNGINIDYIYLIVTIVPAILAPIMGIMSDKWDRGKLLLLGIGLIGTYSIVALPMLLESTNQALVVTLIFIYAILFSVQSGTVNTYVVEIFPINCRFSCGALCYSLGMATIGGTSPMLAAILTKNGNINSVISYVLLVTLMGFASAYFLSTNKNNNFRLNKTNNNIKIKGVV